MLLLLLVFPAMVKIQVRRQQSSDSVVRGDVRDDVTGVAYLSI